MTKLPDPKELVDSVMDGALELAEGPVKIAENVADIAKTFATEARSNLDTMKARLPDDPSVLLEVPAKAIGQTVGAGIGLFEGIGRGVMDTLGAVKNQIKRVTG